MLASLIIHNLSASVEGKMVVRQVSLQVKAGEVHVIMGPNGSGKSSLALALMGHPAYRIEGGKAAITGHDLFSLKPNDRVKMGLFLSFQNPVAIAGVTLGQLVWSSYQTVSRDQKTDIRDFYAQVKNQAKMLGLKEEMLERFVNDGFSGGEKKKAEILMLLNLNPKFAIFDEIDSGLDVDSLKKIAKIISGLSKKEAGIILITHSQRLLKYIKPNFVHVLKTGKIVKSGDLKLAAEIERKGYAEI